jgi:prevent-host-death family protein
METIPALDAKNQFGALLDKAQREPVTISKNGRPVAVVMSHDTFQKHERARLDLLRQEIGKGMEDLKRGRRVPAERAFADLDKELRD